MIDPRLPPQSAPYSDPGSNLFNKLWYLFFEAILAAIRALLKLVNSGTHADRLANKASAYPLGALFFETDRGGIEYQVRMVAKNLTWVYVSGEMSGATLAVMPADLGANDAGFLFFDAQYQHEYQWSGTAWAFAPSDDHLAGQCMFSATAAAPLAGVWVACAGGAALVSKGDGTTVSYAVPDLSSADTFLTGGGLSAIQSATAPTWNGAAVTDDAGAHSHSLATVPLNFTIGGSTLNVESNNVTGAVAAHHHSLSNANAKLNPPSQANGGLPQNIGLNWWMRQ